MIWNWKGSKTVYVVVRTAFTSTYGQLLSLTPCEGEAGSSTVPVIGFGDEKAARTECARLELDCRRTIPFFRGFSYTLSPVGAIQKTLTSYGLPAPKFTTTNEENYEIERANIELLSQWWIAHSSQISPELNATLWEKFFPGFQFYSVVKSTWE
jgi:hypothetical protein